MSLCKLRGVVGELGHEPSLSIGNLLGGRRRVSLSVDGRPVRIRLRSVPGIAAGDRVTAIGHRRSGFFRALAIRNDETQAIYVMRAWPGYVTGLLLVLGFGVPLMLAGSWGRAAGVLAALCGALIVHRAYRRTRALAILRYR